MLLPQCNYRNVCVRACVQKPLTNNIEIVKKQELKSNFGRNRAKPFFILAKIQYAWGAIVQNMVVKKSVDMMRGASGRNDMGGCSSRGIGQCASRDIFCIEGVCSAGSHIEQSK